MLELFIGVFLEMNLFQRINICWADEHFIRLLALHENQTGRLLDLAMLQLPIDIRQQRHQG